MDDAGLRMIRDRRGVAPELERALREADERLAAATAEWERAEAVRRPVQAAVDEAKRVEREWHRHVTDLAYKKLAGEDPAIPAELAEIVAEEVKLLSAGLESRRK